MSHINLPNSDSKHYVFYSYYYTKKPKFKYSIYFGNILNTSLTAIIVSRKITKYAGNTKNGLTKTIVNIQSIKLSLYDSSPLMELLVILVTPYPKLYSLHILHVRSFPFYEMITSVTFLDGTEKMMNMIHYKTYRECYERKIC